MELKLLSCVALLTAHPAMATNSTQVATNSTIEATNSTQEAISFTTKKVDRGCKLTVPDAVLERWEPEQEQTSSLLSTRVAYLDLLIQSSEHGGKASNS